MRGDSEMDAGKRKVKSWDELRGELKGAADDSVCKDFDRLVSEGNKITAIRLLRTYGISIYDD